MQIGVARHFQIPHSKWKWMNSQEFKNWIQWYDSSEGTPTETNNINHSWDYCYASTLARAEHTAKTLYKGKIEKLSELIEVPFAPIFSTSMPLPLFLWQTLSRIAWYLKFSSQPENRSQTQFRIKKFLDEYLNKNSSQKILMVTHGYYMQYLNHELSARGYQGKIPTLPKGGVVYLFEK